MKFNHFRLYFNHVLICNIFFQLQSLLLEIQAKIVEVSNNDYAHMKLQTCSKWIICAKFFKKWIQLSDIKIYYPVKFLHKLWIIQNYIKCPNTHSVIKVGLDNEWHYLLFVSQSLITTNNKFPFFVLPIIRIVFLLVLKKVL